jgi:hypothetical protein
MHHMAMQTTLQWPREQSTVTKTSPNKLPSI